MKADRPRSVVRLNVTDDVVRNGDELDGKVELKSNKASVVLCDINGKNVNGSGGAAIEKTGGGGDDRSRDTAVTPLRVDLEKRLRREIANSNERRRMQSINAGFQTLRSMLPKKGEKMSKAAILQQTADYLQEMDTRNVNLVKQISKLRKLLETKGPRGESAAATELNHVGVQVDALSMSNNDTTRCEPPRKRQRVNKSSSFDDRCSSRESSLMEVEPTKCVAAVQTDRFDGSSEVGVLRQRLFEVQLALDHERQLNYMREEHYCRKLELSHYGSLGHIPAVSMIDFPMSHHHHAAMHNVTKGFTAPNSTLKSGQQSFIPVNGCSLNGDLICAATPPCASSPQAMVFNSNRPSTIWVPITEAPSATIGVNVSCDMKPASDPRGSNTGANGAPPKQSLNAIIEAIRQLEGEELFVDSDCRRAAKWSQGQSGEEASSDTPSFDSHQNGSAVEQPMAPTEEQFVEKSLPKISFQNYGSCENHHREMTVASS
uniref:BHLH domain-containing protein n=1 Tax=Trichuris muris TaxID=70415 RepID=A0A5S6QPS6_TRIMR